MVLQANHDIFLYLPLKWWRKQNLLELLYPPIPFVIIHSLFNPSSNPNSSLLHFICIPPFVSFVYIFYFLFDVFAFSSFCFSFFSDSLIESILLWYFLKNLLCCFVLSLLAFFLLSF